MLLIIYEKDICINLAACKTHLTSEKATNCLVCAGVLTSAQTTPTEDPTCKRHHRSSTINKINHKDALTQKDQESA